MIFKGRIPAIAMFAVILFLSTSASAEGFAFRNGITFGMDELEIKTLEEENGQVLADQWYEGDVSGGHILQSGNKVKVSSYEATLFYLLCDGKMELAWYDFYGDENGTEMYETISDALSVVYGEGTDIEPKKVVMLLDFI